MRFHLFDWPSRHHVHLLLPAMLVVSVLFHVVGIVVFQVAYPRAHTRVPRYAEVFYLRPGSPEAARLLPIIEAEDPALFSPGQIFGRDVWRVPETTYVASFDTSRPSLEALPGQAAGNFLPPVSSGTPVGTAGRPPSAKPAPGLPTTIRLGGSLADRTLQPPGAPAKFSVPPNQRFVPAEFLVAVSPEGVPQHIFLVNRGSSYGSGYEPLDRAAREFLAASRFSPGPQATWGTATFLWGADFAADPLEP